MDRLRDALGQARRHLLRLADTSLVLAQRLGEWVGHAPAIEEDLGLAGQDAREEDPLPLPAADAGDVAVREGEGVVVVELLGMENEIRSPREGKVAELLVQEGQAVEGGARLAVVE